MVPGTKTNNLNLKLTLPKPKINTGLFRASWLSIYSASKEPFQLNSIEVVSYRPAGESCHRASCAG
jgi:hypothetical protein